MKSSSLAEIQLPTLDEIEKEWAKRNLTRFMHRVSPKLSYAWEAKHDRYLAEKLMAVERGEIKRLMVFEPPRHFKSQTASVHFPPWFLGRNPDRRVAITSYSSSLAETFSRQARDKITEYGEELFNIRLSRKSSAVDNWQLDGHIGGLVAVGVGGSLTGKGANCFPSGTMILTINGAIDISTLATMEEPPLVLSYDHINDKLVYKRIIASQRKWSSDFTEITTFGGRAIKSTREHHYYECERGYREAQVLRSGDRLVAVSWEQNLPLVRQDNAQKVHDLPGMLRQKEGSKSYSPLCFLRHRIQQTSIRIREGLTQNRLHKCLLFDKMQSGAPRNKTQQKMSYLWNCLKQATGQILLFNMQEKGRGSNPKEISQKNMSSMWDRISTKIKSDHILFKRLCRRSPFRQNERFWELAFQGRNKLCQMVRSDETDYPREGQSRVSGLREEGKIQKDKLAGTDYSKIKSHYSSRKQRCNEQSAREFNNPVWNVSSKTPFIETDAVSSTCNICGPSIPVYDIQVEGTSNFFANGILVHNCLIIDDPHKDREEANSQTIRDKVWDWYTSTAYTRLEPDGAVILILTRWHEDDLAGRLLKAMDSEDGDKWEVVSFPAFAEENDVLGRQPGEALWPERFTAEKLKSIRVAIGSREFTSLYQQKPQALEGGAFKAPWFNWYTRDDITYNDKEDTWYFLDQPLKIYQGVDPATTEKTYSDDFVDITIGVTPSFEVLVLDDLYGQFDPGDQANMIAENYLDWLPEQIGMEDNGGQKYLVAEVKKWHKTHKDHPIIKVKAVTQTGDKYSRITRLVPFVEAGGLYLRRSNESEEGWRDMDRLPAIKIHPKMRKLYEQLVTFAPSMAHDDHPDALDITIHVGAKRGMQKFFEKRIKEAE